MTFVFSKLALVTNYQVHVHTVENYWDNPQRRVFDIVINGKSALQKFDPFVEAGGKNIAAIKTFVATASDKGEIRVMGVSLDDGRKDNALFSAIEMSVDDTTRRCLVPSLRTLPIGTAIKCADFRRCSNFSRAHYVPFDNSFSSVTFSLITS